MARAGQVGAELHVPASFDRIGGGYSDAPDPAASEHSDPRRVLFLSILHQALSDARNPTARSSGASSAQLEDRKTAVSFLLDERGPRAQWRRTVCHLCGLDIEAFEESIRAESKSWPGLSDYSTPDRRQTHSSRHRSSEGRRGDAEKRREQARQCMRAKRARQRAQPAESYTRRALLVGSGLTRPTYND